MPKSHDENFLVRWSRRKRADRLAPAEQPIDDVEPATNAAGPGSTQGQSGAAEQVTRLAPDTDHVSQPEAVPEDLADVDIETLNYESDFKRFLESDVPEALRKRALRQLWRSDPILANVDGLNDYDEDFSDAALAVNVLETAYKIGQGYLESEHDETENETEGSVSATADANEVENANRECQLASNEENPDTGIDVADAEKETKS